MNVLHLADRQPGALPRGCVEMIAIPPNLAGAKTAFEAGRTAARAFRVEGGYALIEGVYSDDAEALEYLGMALGYAEGSMEQALSGKGLFEKLDATADPLSVFSAGFALEVSRRYSVVLRGGLEMAAALLIADKIAGRDGLPMDPRRITFCTTKTIASHYGPMLCELFLGMDFTPRALYEESL